MWSALFRLNQCVLGVTKNRNSKSRWKMTASLLPWTKRKAEPASKGGFLARYEDFPFQFSRMRAELDRLMERLAGEWPSHWEGNGWRWGLEVEDQDDAVVVRAEAPGFEPGDLESSCATTGWSFALPRKWRPRTRRVKAKCTIRNATSR